MVKIPVAARFVEARDPFSEPEPVSPTILPLNKLTKSCVKGVDFILVGELDD